MPTQAEVFDALKSERAYQDARWGGKANDQHHCIAAWLMFMEDYIAEAKHVYSREESSTMYPKALDIIRKVSALGVAAMEVHGAPKRNGF